jgi:trans-aconitate 2-methyltransferase
MADWSSKQYLKFGNERTQPSIDLVNRIQAEAPKRIVDIGCGPGNSTNVLAERFKGAHVLGVDNSPAMLESAKRNYPEIDFKLCDAGSELPGLGSGFDIVFSNACIQWIPNHQKLLRDMMALLRPGGVIAVQSPLQYEQVIYKIICEVASSGKWSGRFDGAHTFHNLMQGEYFDLLSDISSEFSMWETIYYHRLGSHSEIMEWYRGAGLRPYLNVLGESEKPEFERDILEKIKERYPVQKNGEVIFRFPRLFFIAAPK